MLLHGSVQQPMVQLFLKKELKLLLQVDLKQHRMPMFLLILQIITLIISFQMHIIQASVM